MSWNEQIAHFQWLYSDEDMAKFRQRVADRHALHAQGTWKAIDLFGGWMADILLARGPEAVRELFHPAAEYVAPAVASYLHDREGTDSVSSMIFEVIDATNMFEILGFEVPSTVFPSFRPYLPRIIDDIKNDRTAKGLMGIAFDDRAVWAPIAGYLPDAEIPFAPGAAFGANVPGLIAHLGMARQTKAPFEAIEAAWHSTLAVAPALFSAGVLSTQGLMLLARVVHHHIGGAPLADVAERFCADLARCVREERR